MSKARRFAFILNPQAGRGRARHMERRLLRFLNERSIDFTLERTREPLHATSIASLASKEFDVVVAVGGDGTVNEVANGIAGTNAAMGIVPVGSGNDFNRVVGVPRTLDGALNSLVNGVRKFFDVGQLTFHGSEHDSVQKRRFINSLGIGLDAVVADYTRQIRWLRGLPLYLTAVMRALYRLERHELSFTLDDWQYRRKVFLLCIGNGMFEGGGFRLTPNADPQDQKFEVCAIEDMPILRALGLIPAIIQGRHAQHPRVVMRDASIIDVSSQRPFAVHADGEVLGRGITHVRAEIQAGAVGVLVPPPIL